MSSPSSAAARAWLVVALLWPVALLNYLDRQMLSTVRKSIRDDIPDVDSDVKFAYLMATFMWVYAVASPVGGFLGDRFSRRRTVIASLLVWSAATWLTGYAASYGELLALRALMGVSEAFYIPTALALIADFHSGPTRARAVAVHQTGIYVGLALGGLGGYVADAGTWRNAFVGFGVVGVGYAAVLALALPAAPRDAGPAAAKATARPLDALVVLGGMVAFWILVAYFTLPAVAGWAMKNWLPTHLGDAFSLDQGPAGLWATMSGTVGNVVGAVFGGWLADKWAARHARGRVFASALGTTVCAAALVGLAYAGPFEAAVGCVVLFGVGWGMFDANNMPILCQLVRPEYRATGYGFMNLVSISAGAVATVVMGNMRDRGVSFTDAFVASAGIALAGAALILTLRPRP